MPFRKPIDDQHKARARRLRQVPTFPELLLWGKLRGRRLAGIKFRRQHPLKPYIVDYYCEDAKLIIELDGKSHDGHAKDDATRSAFLKSLGLDIIRIGNDDVLTNLEGVLEFIIREHTRRTKTAEQPE
jgi:very-short-patch-repair endonuclease